MDQNTWKSLMRDNNQRRYTILIIAPLFFPSYGGLEQVTSLLAEAWAKNHHVTLITRTPANQQEDYRYPVLRNPSRSTIIHNLKFSDFIVMHGFSLPMVPLMLPFRKKTFLVHHTYYQRNREGRQNWKDKLKLLSMKIFHNISVSHAVAKHIKTSSHVIHNPFRNDVFCSTEEQKEKDIIFAGRLVSDKGCMVLLKALKRLKDQNIHVSCTIAGDGAESVVLKNYVRENNLTPLTNFVGAVSQKDLAHQLRRHKIMIIPSLWEEPFGLVVLEGLACNCKIIASRKGGIPEALGGFGRLFDAGDDEQLAQLIIEELKQPNPENTFPELSKYLEAHAAHNVAEKYINFIASVLQ